MKKIFKYFAGLIILMFVGLGLYIYKLRALAAEGNKIFALRCTKVNPPLISYKNAFLNLAYCFNNPEKCSVEEGRGYYDAYILGMRKYIPEENKWLEMQKKFMTRWDYKLVEPWYIQQAGEYQWKMYEGYRDHAQHAVDILDLKAPSDFDTNPESKQRLDKYKDLYFKAFDEGSKINDWRKIFGKVSIPVGCTNETLTIPNTTGSIDWKREPSVTPTTIPSNPDLVT